METWLEYTESLQPTPKLKMTLIKMPSGVSDRSEMKQSNTSLKRHHVLFYFIFSAWSNSDPNLTLQKI